MQSPPPFFKTQRSDGDKSSNQLPPLSFNSANGPVSWILWVLTHILHIIIFMQSIQALPLSHCCMNNSTGPGPPRHVLQTPPNMSLSFSLLTLKQITSFQTSLDQNQSLYSFTFTFVYSNPKNNPALSLPRIGDRSATFWK